MSEDLRHLWHKIQVKKYAESPPEKLLYHILHEIEMKKHYGSHRNWEILVELLAKWLVLNVDLTLAGMGPLKPFDGLDMKRDSDLFEHINSLDLFRHYYVAAKNKPWDYIGEVYTKLGLVEPGQDMTPKGVVDLMIQMTYGEEPKKVTTQLDTLVHSTKAKTLCWNRSFLDRGKHVVSKGTVNSVWCGNQSRALSSVLGEYGDVF